MEVIDFKEGKENKNKVLFESFQMHSKYINKLVKNPMQKMYGKLVVLKYTIDALLKTNPLK